MTAICTRPSHGPIACSACFPSGSPAGITVERDGWRIDNNPGYWGASEPGVLVLGFSKGANQRGSYAFDQVAFRNARANLADILTALSILEPGADIDACFTARERKVGFASVVRCGLGKQDEKDPKKYLTSGDVILSSVKAGSPVRRYFDKCTERFLAELPDSVRTVVFLGLDGDYAEALFQRLQELHPTLRRISPLAYATDRVTFVHVMHPSPQATNHRRAWLSDERSGLSNKRHGVLQALGLGPVHVEVPARPIRPAEAPRRPRPAARPVGPERKIADLIDSVREAMRTGALRGQEIGNSRSGGDDVKNLLRLRRADGEEFAIQKSGQDFRVWSSVPPHAATRLAALSDEYPPTRTRHSNLGVMPRLRGPRGGTPGSLAWLLNFETTEGALQFFVDGGPR